MLYLTNKKTDPYSWTDCKVAYFLYYFCSHFSSSLLMIMTVEKCFALYFPLKGKIVCTLINAKKISAVAALVFFAFDMQHLFIFDTKTSGGQQSCVKVGIPKYYRATFNKVDSLLYSFIPLSVMFTANCFIILKFVKAKLNSSSNIGRKSVNQALNKSTVKCSVMLLTVSFAFIFLTTPICIYISVGGLPRMVHSVATILHHLNHGINGVLYCITGSRFRQELKNLFSCNRTKRNMTGSVINTVTSQVRSTTSQISMNLNEI